MERALGAKIINHSILPKIFENDEVENWVMVPDDDELFKVTENLNETKEFLNYVSETLKQNKIFVTSPRINMKRLDGNVSEKVLSDIPIYDQFPVQKNQTPFPYINKMGKQVVNNIGKVVVETQFDYVGDFSKGLAQVKKDYYSAEEIARGEPPRADDYNWGFIDKSGKVVIEPQFNYVSAFSEGLACVR